VFWHWWTRRSQRRGSWGAMHFLSGSSAGRVGAEFVQVISKSHRIKLLRPSWNTRLANLISQTRGAEFGRGEVLTDLRGGAPVGPAAPATSVEVTVG
jgi:hypothetical protein